MIYTYVGGVKRSINLAAGKITRRVMGVSMGGVTRVFMGGVNEFQPEYCIRQFVSFNFTHQFNVYVGAIELKSHLA